ncbi:MAG: dihydrolipoyllysine-residue acetyltransferase [Pseudomonadota bacterium]
MANEIEVRVPDIGDFSDVEVIEVLVSPGDTVAVDDGLVTLETDKASMEVPSTEAGEVLSISVGVGDTISEGDVVAVLRSGAAAPAADPEPEAPAEAEKAPVTSESSEPPAAASEPTTVTVPDIGDFDAVDVIEVAVAVGDTVAVDDALITLETDKASMDVPSTVAGEVVAVHVSVGDQIAEGAAVVEIMAAGGASPAAKPASDTPAATPAPEKPATPVVDSQPSKPATKSSPKPSDSAINEAGFSKAHASPSVRKLARELGADLGQIKGTGHKGRIMAEDLKAWVKKRLTGGAEAGGSLPAVPKVDFAKFGEISEAPLTRIQKISGPRLQASWVNLPHVTQHDEADITDMEARRKSLKAKAAERGIKLTPLAFIMRGVVQALQAYPRMNSSLSADGGSLVQKHYIHIGFAADTDDGLVVPVIHDADKKDAYELAESLAELSALARDGKLKPQQMQGATFTISSLGGIGGTAFTPIVNAPEVGILGVSRSSMQPVWDGEQFQPRLMLPLSLSYDHRVIDGALAVRFTTQLGQLLSDVDGLLQAIP